MSYCYDGRVFETVSDCLLDELIWFHVDIGRGFVNEDELVGSKNSSGDADKLFLSDWKVLSRFGDESFKELPLFEELEQIAL